MTTPTRFHLVDVFADAPLTGNPLALVPDAEHLTDAQMRSIAQEFNLSETTFLLPPTSPGAHWRLRSFTPGGVEVGGAGHNAMGAWLWLAGSGRLPAGTADFIQEIGGELLPVEIGQDSTGRVVVCMDQSPPEFGRYPSDPGALAAALGIGTADLAVDQPAQVVSTGAGHLLVGVRDRDVVDRARPTGELAGILRDCGGEGCYVYSLDPVEPAAGSVAYARFFNPTVGIAEDPATGTAAGPLVAALVARGVLPDGAQVVVEQGFALGRPSRLRVRVAGQRVRLSGSGLVVADGTLHL